MKRTYIRIDDETSGTLPENPTLEERINFLEYVIRTAKPHDHLCESLRPDLAPKKHWWSPQSLTFIYPYPCDCWLSDPIGATGLRINP